MAEEKKFTLKETKLMQRLITVLMIHAPSIRPKSLFVPIDQMEFYWKELYGNQRIEHPLWVSKIVYVKMPKPGDDVVEHILRMVPHLIRQLYEQMDYKEHRVTHVLNHIIHHDRLGKYRPQYRTMLKFYRILLNAYRMIPEYQMLGKTDPQKQYEMKKELYIQYGKGFDLALELYDQSL